jgi:hypothetical protein
MCSKYILPDAKSFASHFSQEALQQYAASNSLWNATALLHAASGNNVKHAASSRAACRILHVVALV